MTEYEQDIQCIIHPSFNKGGLYISNVQAARNINNLKKFHIKAIISIAHGVFLTYTQQQLPNYLYIPAYDSEGYNISVHFQRTYQFIDRHRQHSNVLVHCVAGVSRSATIVMAYLMKKYKKAYKEIYNEIKKIRQIIDPNEGFQLQLRSYEQKIKFQNGDILKSKIIKDNPQLNIYLSKKNNQNSFHQEQIHDQQKNQIDKIQPINLEDKLKKLRFNHKKIQLNFLKTTNISASRKRNCSEQSKIKSNQTVNQSLSHEKLKIIRS